MKNVENEKIYYITNEFVWKLFICFKRETLSCLIISFGASIISVYRIFLYLICIRMSLPARRELVL